MRSLCIAKLTLARTFCGEPFITRRCFNAKDAKVGTEERRGGFFFATFAKTFASSAFNPGACQFGCGCSGREPIPRCGRFDVPHSRPRLDIPAVSAYFSGMAETTMPEVAPDIGREEKTGSKSDL